MPSTTQPDLTLHVIEQAKSLGASLAGVTTLDSLQKSSSHQKIVYDIHLSIKAKSLLVLALAHRESEPELDWWHGSGTAGDTKLISIARNLKRYLREELNSESRLLRYSPSEGGIFLKDAAVLAGLGTIGANNLVITPEFGPRIRLRALAIDFDLVPTEPKQFEPCNACNMSCRQACPQKAFKNGSYQRTLCEVQMRRDEVRGSKDTKVSIKYCRACELACPVGSP
ncbi:MAG: hypothetical protein ACFFBD_22600 [Candidatus Hodarchaeota archaeon]